MNAAPMAKGGRIRLLAVPAQKRNPLIPEVPTFAELGLPWRWDEALYADLLAVMGGKERLAHFIDSAHPADAEALHARAPEIHARKTRAYGDLVAQHGQQSFDAPAGALDGG